MTIELQGTKFTISVLPATADRHWVKTLFSVKNEFIDYEEISERFTREEFDRLLTSCNRLLAGAYANEYSLTFEKSGFGADLYPYLENGEEVERTRRRQEDCVLALRFLFRGAAGKYLGGIYTLLLHRPQITEFTKGLGEEFDKYYGEALAAGGKYLFAAVSPLDYLGCKYWYLDKTKSVRKGDYAWVRMGRRNLEQIVYVDEVKFFDDDSAPYPPDSVKTILRKATAEETAALDD